jgi:NAD(P)-dependent dehydrogenase (short-subunit alcohol dehydrogenase family)
VPNKTKSKSILVTGGASGIGAAIARLATAQGHRVLIADINLKGAQRVAKELGDSTAAIALDITSEQQWDTALDTAWDRFDGLDVLLNNAAIVHTGYVRNMPVSAHQETMDVNAMGPIKGMARALPRFLDQGHGHFVTVCSMTAFLPFPGLASYAAAKHALRAFHHGLAMEERNSPIDFSIIHPTSTETPMLEKEAASDEVPMAFNSASVTAEFVAGIVLTAMDKRTPEVFMPPERARTVRMLGTNARRLLKFAAMAEDQGAQNLKVRRASRKKG